MRPNTTKRLLKDGKPSIGSWLSFPCINTAEVMAHVGWDWLVVDTEHGPIHIETLQQMFIAIGSTNTIPMCRVPGNDPILIKRALDAGSYGCVIPMVCTPEDAERAVKSCKYPPAGIRSVGGYRWRFWAGADYTRYANDEVMVIIQIEHIDAVRRAGEILSVPGIDACFVGPADLAWSMGLAENDPDHVDAVAHVLEVAKKAGVPAGIFCRSDDEVVKRVEQGFQFLSCTNDVAFLHGAASKALNGIRERIES